MFRPQSRLVCVLEVLLQAGGGGSRGVFPKQLITGSAVFIQANNKVVVAGQPAVPRRPGDHSVHVVSRGAASPVCLSVMASGRVPWCRVSEAALLRLVRCQTLLWDTRHPMYHKTKLRQKAFNAIAEELRVEHPELAQLDGNQVRIKFKNLRTYFIGAYNKFKKARSESKKCPGNKWPLFDNALFLIDTRVEQKPTKTSLKSSPTPTSAVLSIGDDGRIIEHSTDSGKISSNGTFDVLYTELGCPPSPVPSNHSFEPSSPSPSVSSSAPSEEIIQKRNTLEKTQHRVKAKKEKKPDDDALNTFDRHLAKKIKVDKFARAIGHVAESAAEKMPYHTQLQFMEKMIGVIKDIDCSNTAANHQIQER